MSIILQYCNEVHHVNSAPPCPTSYAYVRTMEILLCKLEILDQTPSTNLKSSVSQALAVVYTN